MSRNLRYRQIPPRALVVAPKLHIFNTEESEQLITYKAGETIAVNDPCYIENNILYKATLRSADCIALSAGSTDDIINVILEGELYFDGANGDLWNIDGTLTTKRVEGDFIQKIGTMVQPSKCILAIEEGVWSV